MAEESKDYANKVLEPFMKELTQAILKKTPSNIVQFVYDWTKEKLEEGYESPESSSESSSEEEAPAPIPAQAPKKRNVPRTSVSAEAYGEWNKKLAFVPKVVAKSEAAMQKIKELLNKIFMFQALDQKSFQVIVDAMEQISVKPDEAVIKQNDEGNCLYIVESGTLTCTKQFPNEEAPKFLKEYTVGGLFGELALLYNAPRAATIKAKTDCVLWQLDRETFNHIVKDAAVKRRENYENFLSKVPVLASLDAYEKLQLADVLKASHYKAGDYIIKEGELGDTFYILEEGEAYATKTLTKDHKNKDEPPKKVMEYKQGDYFGELALLKNAPRAANVMAKTDCTAVWIDRDGFKRILGPLEEILLRGAQKYVGAGSE